ncbi:hypothetical protein BofuT4_uP028240.1 [Botrytis cinerea T4]|uniref:Uncharacterized protein n=1 Tax=Botryotinia fuckeliana (strain T4) TaxID=999810 RepID=G2YA77_BOTF4|nr:hypothetical protein BofuT4_uP028240.1 [Botrytis cinerea T4]
MDTKINDFYQFFLCLVWTHSTLCYSDARRDILPAATARHELITVLCLTVSSELS